MHCSSWEHHASTAELLRHSWRANCSSGWTPYSTSREGRNVAEGCQCVAGRKRDHSSQSEMNDTMVRSEAVQRMALAAREKASFPSLPVTPPFSVRQSSSDAVTRGLDSSRTTSMGDELLTAKGVPPPSCLVNHCTWLVGSWTCGSGWDFSES